MSDSDICELLLMALCGTHMSMPSAFRSESGRQTERDKHFLGQTLRVFAARAQDDGDESPLAFEFVNNFAIPDDTG